MLALYTEEECLDAPGVRRVTSPIMSFTNKECVRFERRWEEGYDLDHDQRYNDWVKIHHPDCHAKAASPSSPLSSLSVDKTSHPVSALNSPSCLSTAEENLQRKEGADEEGSAGG